MKSECSLDCLHGVAVYIRKSLEMDFVARVLQ